MTDIRCHDCHRFLGSTTTNLTAWLKCPTCKSYRQYTLLNLDTLPLSPVMLTNSGSTKPIKDATARPAKDQR